MQEKIENLTIRYSAVRARTAEICQPLQPEDYVVQPVVDVSPPKWHLGHTTWFWEAFILERYCSSYKNFHSSYGYVFNSYYESLGARVLRTNRGNLSRPTVAEVYEYREYVDEQMRAWFERGMDGFASPELFALVELGLNHEEQHQELLITDIKYILGHNPLFPSYTSSIPELAALPGSSEWIDVPEAIHSIGFKGEGFCFDNELGQHRVFLEPFRIANRVVTNGEYLEFMNAGGYRDFRHWLGEGFQWVKDHSIIAPLYWYNIDGEWLHYTPAGLQPIPPDAPLSHVSYYEADAFAAWRGARLATEFEWEAASELFEHGQVWEWTASAYLPYPGFSRAPGAIGEYNGKFMVNQMVLRGGSCATPPGHARPSYRNFFHPPLRWQFMGIRLAAK